MPEIQRKDSGKIMVRIPSRSTIDHRELFSLTIHFFTEGIKWKYLVYN